MHGAMNPARPLVSFARPVTFRGQLPGERAVVCTRAAWWLVALRAWPAWCSLLALGAVSAAQMTGWLQGPTTVVLQLLLAGLALVMLAWWVVEVAYPWWFTVAVITDQRLLLNRGGIKADDQVISLANVQAVRIVTRSFWAWLLGYGHVEVSAAGGPALRFEGLPRPLAFANALRQARAAQVGDTATVEIADPAMRHLIDELADVQPMPTLPALDPALARGWPLRHAMSVPLEPDEVVVGTISRHWWWLARHEVIPLAILAATAAMCWIAALLAGRWANPQVLAMAVGGGGLGLLGAVLAYLNFVDDSFVLTNVRLLDVNRRFFVFYEATDEITYDAIQKVESEIPTLWARLVGYGSVIINVGGTNPPIMLDHIPRADLAAQALERCRAITAERAKVASANRERLEKKEWFVSVLNEMVIEAPELRGLPLEDAIEAAYAVGLRLLVLGESRTVPGMPAGIVITQSPFPGARALRGGDISVMLTQA